MNITEIPSIENLLQRIPYHKRRKKINNGETKYPKLLFKFTNPGTNEEEIKNRIKEVVVHGGLYFNNPSKFNDPFEFKVAININSDNKLVRKYLEDLHKRKTKKKPPAGLISTHMQNIQSGKLAIQDTYDRMAGVYGVTCFTTRHDNLLMWSHYADCHRGICYAYSPERDVSTLIKAQKVRYSKTYPTMTWPDQRPELLEKLILAKSHEWEYEDEYRVFGDMSDGIRRVQLNHSALRAVIIGARAKAETERAAIDACIDRHNKGFTTVRVIKAFESRDSYCLKFKTIY